MSGSLAPGSTVGPSLADRLRALAAAAGDAVAVVEGGVVTTWAMLDAAADAAGEGVSPGEVVPFDAPAGAAAIARIVGVLRAGGVAAALSAGMAAGERAAMLEVLQGASVPPDTALIVMTSGTTGRPKGVAHSEASLRASSAAWRASLPAATGWVLALGLGHVAGLGVVWRAIDDGVPVRIVPSADPAALAKAIRDPAMSHVSLVPTQLIRLLDLLGDAPPPPNLLAIPLGGGAIPEALVRRALSAGWPVVPTYGLSEMGSGVTALRSEEAAAAPATAGQPMPGVTLAIAEPDDDGIGEVVVGGPSSF
ncbi:MAG TPA: AMP-binding protein, partial [Candidatus Limnocylindrales bacterium]